MSQHVDLECAGYSRFQHSDHTLLNATSYPPAPSWTHTDEEWDVIEAQNPFCIYADENADPYFSARRLSDVVDVRFFRQTELWEMAGFTELPHVIQMRLPAETGTHWTVEATRSGRDFSSRDVLMLNALRPALRSYDAYGRSPRSWRACRPVHPTSTGEFCRGARTR